MPYADTIADGVTTALFGAQNRRDGENDDEDNG